MRRGSSPPLPATSILSSASVSSFSTAAPQRGIVISILTEGLTGAGIAHQIGLGALVDGYAACRTQFLPFCF